MTDDNQHTVALADLSTTKVREENPQVAEALQNKEDRINELQNEKAEVKTDLESARSEIADLEDRVDELEAEQDEVEEAVREEYEEQIDELESELATKTEIIEDIRESERSELLDEIRQARATIKDIDPEEVDLAEFEDKSPDELRPTADALTEAAETVSQRTNSAASSSREEIDTTASEASVDETRKREVARDMGVLDQLEEADELRPQGFQVDAN